ncbi:GNAT family N-acetyltransferase [Bdellovibrio sp. HCB337]|uniref:GNAT family N-acetyltransferase n=1 Tax=Bdellovibrio sp. HCB337 TaxID=3394358 RepID=UPI0039A53181
MEWKKDTYIVSDDTTLLDVDAIHRFLTNSYWAKGRTKETVANSIKSSFTIGMFQNKEQVGFARVITDYCTFAYLCDVYVEEAHRQKRLGHFLMECLFQHPKLTSVKWLLKTSYSQSLYRDFHFKEIETTAGWMLRTVPPQS